MAMVPWLRVSVATAVVVGTREPALGANWVAQWWGAVRRRRSSEEASGRLGPDSDDRTGVRGQTPNPDPGVAAPRHDGRFSALLEAAPDAVVVIDAAGLIVLVNEQTERLFQYRRQDLVGQPVEVLIPERFRAEHGDRRGRYVADPRRRPMGAGVALAGRRRDGIEFPVDISLSSIETEETGTLAMAFIRDISERRAAETALAAANAEVADRAEKLEGRNREIVILGEMGNLLQSCVSSEEAYEVIGRFAPQLFAGDDGAVFVRQLGDQLEAVAQWGNVLGPWLGFGSEDCWALRRGLPHVGGETASEPDCMHVGAFAGEYICVPMMAQSQSMGVVHVRSQLGSSSSIHGGFRSEATRSLAAALTEHVALALANISLRDTLRHQSVRDPLTDLYNRRFLGDYIERELRRAARKESPVSILMIDIDRFKQFNDEFGHATGDALLVNLARLLTTQLRGADVACRYGGEEFALVLPDCSIEAAARRAQELLERAGELRVTGAAGGITLSIGVSAYPAHGLTAQPLLEAADAALYVAKRRGRGCVELRPIDDLSKES
jgi:diguanylate cyclase (GGDEF)-like protein/PAS domain S-box-containing protein